MEDKHLHIVTHDVPYPADFGGVIDLFYKIKMLHQFGIKIHLHCYTKIRLQQAELNKYCVSVNYYKREELFSGFSLRLPYVVNSRKSTDLLINLQKDTYPILLEGIHTTYNLFANKLKDRKVFIRLYNVEYKYYEQLAKNEQTFLKRFYYLTESKLLKKYEQKIANKATILAMSKQDVELYQQIFAAKDVRFLPAFIPYNLINSKKGKGEYCLYHGNLSINENEEVAIWLLQHVFKDLDIPFIIAGKNPSQKLQLLAKLYPLVSLIENPTDDKMQQLIMDAQINVLPSFNNTGVKLKLLNALFNGKYCIVNNAGAAGSTVEHFCTIAETAQEFKNCIPILFDHDFGHLELQQRQNILKYYSNAINVQQLITWIY